MVGCKTTVSLKTQKPYQGEPVYTFPKYCNLKEREFEWESSRWSGTKYKYTWLWNTAPSQIQMTLRWVSWRGRQWADGVKGPKVQYNFSVKPLIRNCCCCCCCHYRPNLGSWSVELQLFVEWYKMNKKKRLKISSECFVQVNVLIYTTTQFFEDNNSNYGRNLQSATFKGSPE